MKMSKRLIQLKKSFVENLNRDGFAFSLGVLYHACILIIALLVAPGDTALSLTFVAYALFGILIVLTFYTYDQMWLRHPDFKVMVFMFFPMLPAWVFAEVFIRLLKL